MDDKYNAIEKIRFKYLLNKTLDPKYKPTVVEEIEGYNIEDDKLEDMD
jgi:hypothetical protein